MEECAGTYIYFQLIDNSYADFELLPQTENTFYPKNYLTKDTVDPLMKNLQIRNNWFKSPSASWVSVDRANLTKTGACFQ